MKKYILILVAFVFFASCSFDERDQQENIQEQRAFIRGKTEYLEGGYTK